MNWRAVRLPILLAMGFALPALIVAGLRAVPRDFFRPNPVPKPPVVQANMEPVFVASHQPEAQFDPFRPVAGTKTSVEQPMISVEEAPPPAAMTAAPGGVAESPGRAEDSGQTLPEPKLEGVVGGDDPVAVISIDGDSHFARRGDKLPGNIVVSFISESEVRLKRGNTELVLKTGLR
jgi:hypothetical protein